MAVAGVAVGRDVQNRCTGSVQIGSPLQSMHYAIMQAAGDQLDPSPCCPEPATRHRTWHSYAAVPWMVWHTCMVVQGAPMQHRRHSSCCTPCATTFAGKQLTPRRILYFSHVACS